MVSTDDGRDVVEIKVSICWQAPHQKVKGLVITLTAATAMAARIARTSDAETPLATQLVFWFILKQSGSVQTGQR